jgi:hypothetical protein
MKPVTPGWTCVGVLSENEPLTIEGVDAWAPGWEDLGERITVADPGRPFERLDARVYGWARPDGRLVQHAAQELVMGLYGFWVPAGAAFRRG